LHSGSHQGPYELAVPKSKSKQSTILAVNEADIILTEASIRAQEITNAWETEVLAIALAKTSLTLTNDGVLAYLSNRLYKSVDNLQVTAGEPARLAPSFETL
jgi:hypothetical protein